MNFECTIFHLNPYVWPVARPCYEIHKRISRSQHFYFALFQYFPIIIIPSVFYAGCAQLATEATSCSGCQFSNRLEVQSVSLFMWLKGSSERTIVN